MQGGVDAHSGAMKFSRSPMEREMSRLRQENKALAARLALIEEALGLSPRP